MYITENQVISLDTETIKDYVGVRYTLVDETHPKFGQLITPVHAIGEEAKIEPNGVMMLHGALQEAEAVVIHNVAYDAVILCYLFDNYKTGLGIKVRHVKELNDWMFNHEDREMIKGYQQKKVKELKEKWKVNAVCTLDILSNGGKGAFIGLKTLQNAFGLTVDKHEFTEDTRYTVEFDKYFDNDVTSLRDIWNKHWQFGPTFESRKVALQLLDLPVDKFLVFGPLSRYLDFILGTDNNVLPYEFIEDFAKKPMPTSIPQFKEHTEKVFGLIDKMLNDNLTADEKKSLGTSLEYWDNKIDYSLGGIHSVHKDKRLFRSDDEDVVVHVDVASLYPSIILANKELFRFMDVDLYAMVKKKRLEFKRAGRGRESDAFKLILNSSYGIINSMMTTKVSNKIGGVYICLEGHRLILRMMNYIEEHLTDFELIQLNTDGIYLKMRRDELQPLDKAIELWEEETGMEMDVEHYDYIFQENVNNYIARETGKGVHRKGKFSTNFKSFHNTSCPRTVRDMTVNLLDGKEPFFGLDRIVGIFDTKTAQNYWLTDSERGEPALTPKGNPKKIGGNPYTFITHTEKDAVLQEYIFLAECVLDPDKLDNFIKERKVQARALKVRTEFEEMNPEEQLKKVNNNHVTAIKHHKEKGFDRPLTKLQYKKWRLANGK